MLDPVTINTTFTPIFESTDPRGRRWWNFRWPKEATETLYIGTDSKVTTANGYPIYPGESVETTNGYFKGIPACAAVYGIVGSAESATVRRMSGN